MTLAQIDRQLVLGEIRFTLRGSARAQAALQEHYGLDSLKAVGARLSQTEEWGIDDVVALVYAALRTHHPDVSKDDVLGMLDEHGLEAPLAAALEAFTAAMPQGALAAEQGEGSAGGNPRRNGRSTASSRSVPRSG